MVKILLLNLVLVAPRALLEEVGQSSTQNTCQQKPQDKQHDGVVRHQPPPVWSLAGAPGWFARTTSGSYRSARFRVYPDWRSTPRVRLALLSWRSGRVWAGGVGRNPDAALGVAVASNR
jgi:hypothetical protein